MSAQVPWNAERYANAERATRPFARALLQHARLEDTSYPIHLFDLACGTGAVVAELYDAVPRDKWYEVKVLAGDKSAGMVQYVQQRSGKEGWDGVQAKEVDGNFLATSALPPFTHALCTFSLFAMPNALSALHATLAPHGFVGIATWTKLPWASLLARCIARISNPPYNPTESEIMARLNNNVPWNDPSYVSQALRGAGFGDVQTDIITASVPTESIDLFMDAMTMVLGLIKTFWPEDRRDACVEEVSGIMRTELKEAEEGVGMVFTGVVAWGWKGEV